MHVQAAGTLIGLLLILSVPSLLVWFLPKTDIPINKREEILLVVSIVWVCLSTILLVALTTH